MTTQLTVPDMSCDHCKMSVEKALSSVEGVAQATVDLESKKVTVEHGDGVAEGSLREAVAAAGYSVAAVSR